jgi:hypothetical protein
VFYMINNTCLEIFSHMDENIPAHRTSAFSHFFSRLEIAAQYQSSILRLSEIADMYLSR